MIIKIEELREATDWQVPIFVKIGACRRVRRREARRQGRRRRVVVDGMEGGTAASPDLLQDHTGIPTLAAVCEAREALEDIGLYGEVQLDHRRRHPVGRRRGQGARPRRRRGLHRHRCADRAELQQAPLRRGLRGARVTRPYACHHCHTGRCPVGITTQDPELSARLRCRGRHRARGQLPQRHDLEIQMLARAAASRRPRPRARGPARLTLEAEAITGVPLVGRIHR